MLGPCPTPVPMPRPSRPRLAGSGRTLLSARTRPPSQDAPPAESRRRAPRPEDDLLNQQMTALLRQAAEGREDRQQTRTVEDERAGVRATAALYALVDRGPGNGKQ